LGEGFYEQKRVDSIDCSLIKWKIILLVPRIAKYTAHLFGSFEADITVPDHCRVAFSGDLRTPSEQVWLDSLALHAAGLDSFPALRIPKDLQARRSRTLDFGALNPEMLIFQSIRETM
jgi:hypothetical protein